MNIEWKQCRRVGISVFILFLCITYWKYVQHFISVVFSALTPFLAGIVIAYLLNILMDFYEQHYFQKSRRAMVLKTRRAVCMLLAILTMIGVVAILIYMIIPELISCFSMLLEKIPGMIKEWSGNPHVKKAIPKDMMVQLNQLDWNLYAEKITKFLTSGLGGAVGTVATVASSIFSNIVSGVLGLIFALYMLSGKETLQSQCKRVMRSFLQKKWYEKSMYYLAMANDIFHDYIVGKLIDAVILGVMCAVAMAIFRLPYALMIGALIGFTALIPIAGAYIGAGVGAFMILTISPVKAVVFLILIVVLQQIEGNLIYPKVMSNSIGLPGIWVLAAVTVGGSISGITGMLIGVPIAAIFYRIIKEEVAKREE